MSRDDGFSIMDVSVDLTNDPKVRRLFRHAPDHAGVAFLAYVATMGESWKQGRRVNIDDAWPPVVPFSRPALEALIHVGLITTKGLVTTSAWRGWYEPARQRREEARARWARYNAKRHGLSTDDDAEPAQLPRGSDVGTATSVPPVSPSVPPVRPKDPQTPAKRGLRANGENPRSVAAKAREERKRRINEVRMAYYRGEITEAQRNEQLGALS